MSNIMISLAAEFTGKKAFRQAEDKTTGLEKSAKKLAKALAAAFAVDKVVDFGKASVKAFMEDEKAAVQLATAVKNLGLAFETPAIESFISTMSKSAAVSDDELRPAMQALLTTTGSLAKSQTMLSDAINISRGSGVDLATVAQDLANAYVGNTRGLKKYNLGLSQAELKAASFLDIQEKLNKQFSGANSAYLTTYAGKMQILTVSAKEAQETIGKGLVDALTLAGGGSTDIDKVTASMTYLSDQVANAARGVGVLIGYFSQLDKKISGGWIGKILKEGQANFSILGILAKLGATTQAPEEDPNSFQARQRSAYENAAARKKAEAEAAKRAKELAALLNKQNKATKALTDEQKKQLALKKASSIFDMQQIELIAALKGNVSAEDRKRLELQLALATGNLDEAKKLTYELAISQGMTAKLAADLASLPAANNPFAAWKGYLDEIELQAKRIASFGTGSASAVVLAPTNTSGGTGTGAGASVIENYRLDQLKTNVVPLPSSADVARLAAPIGKGASTIGDYLNVVVQIDGKAVAAAVQNQNNSGNTTGFTRLGSFGTP